MGPSDLKALTDLPGLDALLALLDRLAAADQPSALLYTDVETLRSVNRQFGHQVGDHLLVAVVTRLQASCPDAATIARADGEDFAVVLPGTTVQGAVRVAMDVAAALGAPVEAGPHVLVVPVGVGVAPVSSSDEGHHGLDEAARCCGLAKSRGVPVVSTDDEDPGQLVGVPA